MNKTRLRYLLLFSFFLSSVAFGDMDIQQQLSRGKAIRVTVHQGLKISPDTKLSMRGSDDAESCLLWIHNLSKTKNFEITKGQSFQLAALDGDIAKASFKKELPWPMKSTEKLLGVTETNGDTMDIAMIVTSLVTGRDDYIHHYNSFLGMTDQLIEACPHFKIELIDNDLESYELVIKK